MSKITYHNDKEFGPLKITNSNKKGKFIFLGDKYSMSVFRSVKGIKIYVDDSHLFINLVQDKYGRMFYHSWFEDMNFGGGPDFLEESFSLVKDENEADRIFQGKLPMYRRLGHIPFVCWSEEDFVLAVESAAEDTIS
jgi:hypothetical protein